MQLKIIDVSKYQIPSNINYAKLAKNVDGVIIRLGYRGYGTSGVIAEDTYFEEHLTNFYRAGVTRIGVYFFSQAISTLEAVAEANFCVKKMKQYKDKITFPVFFDSEYSNAKKNGRADKLGKASRTDVAIAFLKTVEEAGYTAGIYASTSWYQNNLDDARLKAYTHWVADYRGKNGYGTSDGWQYSDKSVIQGYGGYLDTSYFYKDFTTKSTASNTAVRKDYKQGEAVKLVKANIYLSQDSTTPATQKTGTYYIYDGKLMRLGRYRLTSKKEHCGKGAAYITGYCAYTNFK